MMQVKLSFIDPELREAPYTIVTVRMEMRTLHKLSFDLKPWKNHALTQSLLGALLLAPIILIFEEHNLLIVASLGSTIFVVFAIPSSKSARARNVLADYSSSTISTSSSKASLLRAGLSTNSAYAIGALSPARCPHLRMRI